MNDDERFKGKAKMLQEYFKYSPFLSMEEMENIHIPSVFFPNKNTLHGVLEYCTRKGYLVYEKERFSIGKRV